MTIYYQLENMLVAGFKSEEELQRYQGLKAEYEEETLDYSFSIREIVNQLEIIIQSRENDFPNLEEGLLQDYQELVEYLRNTMCLRQKNTQGEFIVVERYRTVLKKFYITKSQNHTLNYLISYTGLRNFSNYARKMLFKKFPIVVVFDETSFEDLIFSLRRIKSNINQLARIAEQSQDLQALRAMTYSVQMIEKYEKSFLKYHKTKKGEVTIKSG
ncbi:Tn5252, Orf 9 protein [Streptococcus agalactiae]|nr:Tn5252, Orf 9 protein [Streptococcus agalactiae]